MVKVKVWIIPNLVFSNKLHMTYSHNHTNRLICAVEDRVTDDKYCSCMRIVR
jgi:hypothetical protein